jgi:hypothetical protein
VLCIVGRAEKEKLCNMYCLMLKKSRCVQFVLGQEECVQKSWVKLLTIQHVKLLFLKMSPLRGLPFLHFITPRADRPRLIKCRRYAASYLGRVTY